MLKQDMSKDMKIIGQNLKGLRREHGLTQKEIANKLGVSFQQVQKYETGQNKLPIENLYALKQYYGIGFDAFFRGVPTQSKVAKTDKTSMDAETKNALKTIRKLEKMQDTRTKRKIICVIQILLA